MTVLVADPFINRDHIAERMLEPHGLRVVSFERIGVAAEMTKYVRPDLVISQPVFLLGERGVLAEIEECIPKPRILMWSGLEISTESMVKQYAPGRSFPFIQYAFSEKELKEIVFKVLRES